jgi:hypothetical protein
VGGDGFCGLWLTFHNDYQDTIFSIDCSKTRVVTFFIWFVIRLGGSHGHRTMAEPKGTHTANKRYGWVDHLDHMSQFTRIV